MTNLAELKRQLKEIQIAIAECENSPPPAPVSARKPLEEMSMEVVDSNPYSRLMALKRMGIVKNYEEIRNFTVLIVGLGGIGSVAAEMLTRCGIGKIIMYDYDTVEIANMNRLFFRPEQAGMTKTAAAKQTLQDINPDVIFEEYTMDITTSTNFEQLLDRIQNGGINNGKGNAGVDLVLSCVDNYSARISINAACNELNQVWMESGVSEDAVSGHIQTLLPGRTACFECLPPLLVASGIPESTLKREGVCAASLPTTMGLVAALLVQNTLKYLLRFGKISYYLGYSALSDFFPREVMRPNPECENRFCSKQQQAPAHKNWVPHPDEVVSDDTNAKPLHEENEWGIEIEGGDVSVVSQPDQTQIISSGLSFAYEKDSKVEKLKKDADDKEFLVKDTESSLEDLMGQLNSL